MIHLLFSVSSLRERRVTMVLQEAPETRGPRDHQDLRDLPVQRDLRDQTDSTAETVILERLEHKDLL